MSDPDALEFDAAFEQQVEEWEKHVRASHSLGLCPHSGKWAEDCPCCEVRP